MQRCTSSLTIQAKKKNPHSPWMFFQNITWYMTWFLGLRDFFSIHLHILIYIYCIFLWFWVHFIGSLTGKGKPQRVTMMNDAHGKSVYATHKDASKMTHTYYQGKMVHHNQLHMSPQIWPTDDRTKEASKPILCIYRTEYRFCKWGLRLCLCCSPFMCHQKKEKKNECVLCGKKKQPIPLLCTVTNAEFLWCTVMYLAK